MARRKAAGGIKKRAQAVKKCITQGSNPGICIKTGGKRGDGKTKTKTKKTKKK